jgi:hypothetical protein
MSKGNTYGHEYMRRFAPIWLAMATAVLASCATVPRANLVTVQSSSECVVLIHGLNRSWRAMGKMAVGLQRQGFTTANVDYPSQASSVEGLAPMAVDTGIEQCREIGAARIHFVTHSLGGILLRYRQGQEPIPELGRVVMLGPPNQGSEVIDRTRNWPGTKLFSGEAGMQLGTGPDSIPAQLSPIDFELGVIAGVGTINPFMSAMLPDKDDGKVTVERTKVEGMTDFMVVDSSHAFIMNSDTVIRNTAEFLKTGRFSHLP